MDYSHLTISQMAKINHLTAQTLRYYEHEGLLAPEIINPETGYRYYHIKQNAQLDMIKYLKSLGISLKEIKEHFQADNHEEIINLLQKKRSQIDDHIFELNLQKKAIKRTIESIQQYECSPPDGTIVLEFIPRRNIFCHDWGINFYGGDISLYEQMLHSLKETFRNRKIPEIYLNRAGTIMPREAIFKNQFYSSVIFVVADREFIDESLLSSLPASTYLCIYCDEFEKEREYAQRLFSHISEKGYIISGDYICEIIHEPPASSRSDRKMFLRLQVPVKFS